MVYGRRFIIWSIAIVLGIGSLIGLTYTPLIGNLVEEAPHVQAKEMEWSAPKKTKKPAKKRKAFHPTRLSANDVKLLANAVYGEARGEPYNGQVAIAAVIFNRLKSPSFPDTVAGVIFEPRAFTAVADGQIYLTPNAKAKKAVQDAMKGWDPSGGCTYYFNPSTATSKWIWGRPQVKRIGKHIFCR